MHPYLLIARPSIFQRLSTGTIEACRKVVKRVHRDTLGDDPTSYEVDKLIEALGEDIVLKLTDNAHLARDDDVVRVGAGNNESRFNLKKLKMSTSIREALYARDPNEPTR